MEIIDKTSKSAFRSDFCFVSLLDSAGNFITGIGIAVNVNGNLQVIFPGSTIDLNSVHAGEGQTGIAVRLPAEVKE